MANLMFGVGTFCLCSAIGIASSEARFPQETPSPRLSANANIATAWQEAHRELSIAAAGSTRPPIAPKEMSEEEKQRRRDECERVYEFCYDWCSRSRTTKKAQEACYRGCSEANADCRQRIPD